MILTRCIFVFVVIGAVGTCGGVEVANTAAWIGTWNSSGTQSMTCGRATSTSQITGVVGIVAGMEVPHSIVMTIENCVIQSDLMGAKATAGSQVCTLNAGGTNVTVTWTLISAMLSGSTITGTNTGSTNSECSFTQQYTLTKM
jgi:hypothetical protein